MKLIQEDWNFFRKAGFQGTLIPRHWFVVVIVMEILALFCLKVRKLSESLMVSHLWKMELNLPSYGGVYMELQERWHLLAMEFLQWIIQGLAFQMVFMAIFQALISLSMRSLSITPTSKFYLSFVNYNLMFPPELVNGKWLLFREEELRLHMGNYNSEHCLISLQRTLSSVIPQATCLDSLWVEQKYPLELHFVGDSHFHLSWIVFSLVHR